MSNGFVEGLIRQGEDAISVLTKDGIVYRKESIETFQEVVFHGLKADKPKTFKLEEYIKETYHVMAITMNYSFDDSDASNVSTLNSDAYSGGIELRRIKNNKSVARLQYGVGLGRVGFERVFLRPDESLRITVAQDASEVILVCKPVNLLTPINVHA